MDTYSCLHCERFSEPLLTGIWCFPCMFPSSAHFYLGDYPDPALGYGFHRLLKGTFGDGIHLAMQLVHNSTYLPDSETGHTPFSVSVGF